jgi:hypothetical protein
MLGPERNDEIFVRCCPPREIHRPFSSLAPSSGCDHGGTSARNCGCRRITAIEEKGQLHETSCCYCCRAGLKLCCDDVLASDAACTARSHHCGRRGHYPRRRRLRSRLAPRTLWRLPPAVQLPSRLALGAVWPAVLPQLVSPFFEAGTLWSPLCYFPRKPSTSSLYRSGASRNTRCPVFWITSARPFGISSLSDLASSAL